MAATFLVLRTNDTSPQLYFHDGQNIDPTGLGALPGAALESLAVFGGSRDSVMHANRVFTFLDSIFVIQDGKIFISTDEGATFTLDFTFTGASATYHMNVVGPVPVMVSGALKLIGFYQSANDIFVFEYDVAGDTWSDADTGVDSAAGSPTATVPVVYGGLVHARVGDVFIAYDPVSTGTVMLTAPGISAVNGGQMISWNGDLWTGPCAFGGDPVIARLVGSSWDGATGLDLGTGPTINSDTAMHGLFVDAVGNLIVMWTTATSLLRVMQISPGLVVTNITGTVAGAGLTSLGANLNPRYWPHITRTPGGGYTVEIYAAPGPDTSDPVERFVWVNNATQITEIGIVGGSGDMAFPYSIQGGDYNGFFVGEKRTFQTAQAATPTGINITCETFQQGGTTLSVRGHFDAVGAGIDPLTLDPMTLANPTGTGGLSVSGVNPGSQVDGVPVDRTPVSFDWDQVTDGFVTGDNYNFQLEAL